MKTKTDAAITLAIIDTTNTTIKGAANILAAGGSVRKMRQTMLAAAR